MTRPSESGGLSEENVGQTVETTQGALTGVLDGDLVIFRGIRYAAAPVGELRFRAPEPPPDSDADATGFGPRCIQLVDGALVGEEDCLTLNIWTHRQGRIEAGHVFHTRRGGISTVRALNPSMTGAALARATGATVVTINYRLSALGFYASLSQKKAEGATGNFGILDTIAALRWVQQEIHRFGGDPERVLAFGESAGAMTTCLLLGLEEANGLFAAAAMQSGPCLSLPHLDQIGFFNGSADQAAGLLADQVECAKDDLACLRAVDAETLIRAADRVEPYSDALLPFERFVPVIDGDLVEAGPLEALRDRNGAAVPIIVGANSEDTDVWTRLIEITPLRFLADTWPKLRLLGTVRFGLQRGNGIVDVYEGEFDDPLEGLKAFVNDWALSCPALFMARAASLFGPTGTAL